MNTSRLSMVGESQPRDVNLTFPGWLGDESGDRIRFTHEFCESDMLWSRISSFIVNCYIVDLGDAN